jgi:fibronectin-binding autotransporter adhesin
MKKFQLLSVIAVLLAGLGLLTSGAQATSYTWSNTSSGDWSNPVNWGGSGPPSTSTDTAFVDGGKATAVTVSVDGNYTVNQLKIDSDDAVSVNDGKTFSLGGTTPVLDVAGTFTLNSGGTSSFTTLNASTAATLQGDGTLMLAGPNARVTGSTITQGAKNTIQGQGYITAPLINNGYVIATGSGLDLGSAYGSGNYINNGTMTANGGPLTFRVGGFYTLTNNGTIQNNASTDTLSFASSTISTTLGTTGLIDPKGGTVLWSASSLTDHRIGAGTLQMSGSNTFYGQNTLEGTHITLANGGILSLQDRTSGNTATLIGGDVTLASTGSDTKFSAGSALSLQSNLYLNGPSARVAGNTITLAAGHIIQGQGYIDNNLINNGKVIATGSGLNFDNSGYSVTNSGTMTANGGPLRFSHQTITNNNLIQNYASTDTLSFANSTITTTLGTTGHLDPKGGTVLWSATNLWDHQIGAGAVQMSGANTFYGQTTLDPDTHIALANGGTLTFIARTGGNSATLIGGDVTLDGSSSTTTFSAGHALSLQSDLYLNGPNAKIGGTTITLASGKTIQGQGLIELNNGSIVNNGTITAQGGTLAVHNYGLSGDGTLAIAGGSTLDLQFVWGQKIQTGYLTMAQSGNLKVADNLTVGLSKDFAFSQTAPSTWNWGTGTTLAMNGDGTGNGGYGQRLEIGGKDSGNVADGFVSNTNFNLKNLKIGDNVSDTHTLVFLSDWINNGQRTGTGGTAEALYVDSLFVGLGDTLNLNGLHLYTIHGGSAYLITTSDSGATWLGGGSISNLAVPVPLPSTLLLLGSGLLGLAGLRRRFRQN